MKNIEELENPDADLRCGKTKAYSCGGSPPFSGLIQVDAAAEVDEDEVLCGSGGGARCGAGAARGLAFEPAGLHNGVRGSVEHARCTKAANEAR